MSFYLSIITKEIDKKKDSIKQLLKKLPLVCNNLYSSFVTLPKLNPVRLIENSHVFELPNELELSCLDELFLFFQSLKEASTFLQIKELIHIITQCFLKNPESGGVDIIISFLVHTYMDYSYFIQSNSKDIEQIKLIFNEQNSYEFEMYKTFLNCTTLQLIDSWKEHGSFLSSYFKENQTLPEPEFHNLQNLFLQLHAFQATYNPLPTQLMQPTQFIQPLMQQTQFIQPLMQPTQFTQPDKPIQEKQHNIDKSQTSLLSFSNTSKLTFQSQDKFNPSTTPFQLSKSSFQSSVSSVSKKSFALQTSQEKESEESYEKHEYESDDKPEYDFYS